MSKFDSSQIEQHLKEAISRSFPNEQVPKFILGISGGPDSMCLLYLFHELRIEALVVHINYGKRGAESDKDARLVEEMACQWGYECQTIGADPGSAEDRNFQQWARNFRYEVFRSLADEYDLDGIALAHHQDDQVETILQKIFRGAGLASWSAMETWDGELFRPLLPFSRQQIMAFIEERAVPYRVDQSNLESEFARNFLRNEWLDSLADHFPGWKKNVLRIPGQARLFSEALSWIRGELTDESHRLDREGVLNMSPSLRRAVILHMLKEMQPGIEISRKALEQLDRLCEFDTGKAVQLTESISLLRDRSHFKLVYEQPDLLNLIILHKDRLRSKPVSVNDIQFHLEDYENPRFDRNLYLDADKLAWPLTIRRWKEGDRFQPLGMQGHQNISDHLTNRKISAAEKNKAIVVDTFEENICAVIFPPIENRVPPGSISELARCDSSTRMCLTIKRIS